MSAERHRDFTVKDLIEYLTKAVEKEPQLDEYVVYLSGCDCCGRWDGNMEISHSGGSREILLQRTDR